MLIFTDLQQINHSSVHLEDNIVQGTEVKHSEIQIFDLSDIC